MSDKRIEVDIAAAVALLQESPELCEVMNKLIGVPALDAALAEIELLRAQRDATREVLEGMIAVAEGRFDGNPHADIDALAKAHAALKVTTQVGGSP